MSPQRDKAIEIQDMLSQALIQHAKAKVRELATDLDFAIDITVSRRQQIARFERLCAKFLQEWPR